MYLSSPYFKSSLFNNHSISPLYGGENIMYNGISISF